MIIFWFVCAITKGHNVLYLIDAVSQMCGIIVLFVAKILQQFSIYFSAYGWIDWDIIESESESCAEELRQSD